MANDYLDSILQRLGLSVTNYTVMHTDEKYASSSGADTNLGLAKVVYLNETYYNSLYVNHEERRAAVIFPLTHEAVHLMNDDPLCKFDTTERRTFTRELIADERAGYMVGSLTHVGIGFFDDALPRILTDSASNTHPPISFRMLAAKGGWIRAKTESMSSGSIHKFGGVCLKRVDYSSQVWFAGEIDLAKRPMGVWVCCWPKIAENLYCYEFDVSGKGALAVDNRHKEGYLYMGHRCSNNNDGYGALFYSNGQVVQGYWKNSLFLSSNN